MAIGNGGIRLRHRIRKRKRKKVADCLSRLFHITSYIPKQAMWGIGISGEEDETAELKTQRQKIEILVPQL